MATTARTITAKALLQATTMEAVKLMLSQVLTSRAAETLRISIEETKTLPPRLSSR